MTVVEAPNPADSSVSKSEEKPNLNDSGHDSVSATPDSERAGTPGDAANTSLPLEAMFRLTIQPTVGESFEIQANSAEMIQELHQILLEREATCHRTCFSLQLNGVTLDNFTEIRNIDGMVDGSTLHVVDEPYTVREARIHMRHVRDLLRGPEAGDSANAIDCASLTYLSTINLQERNNKEKPFEGHPPEYVQPGTKDRLLSHILPVSTKPLQALRNFSISSFNPPLGPRKMKGDVLYLYVDTVEKRRIHITCCTRGFFVNSSSDDSFNPAVHSQYKTVYQSLVDLLNALSPGFKKAFTVLIKQRSERSMMERLPTPYPVHSWLAPTQDVSEDGIRAEDFSMPHRVGFEDHLPGQIRDWNEELQTTHEMPRVGLSERVIRDRSVFKIHGDFISAAIKGATAVVDGNVMAINPADEPRTHMFIWNNIFFSLGFDVKDHYKELGGDAAAFAATTADLNGVKAYAAVDDSKLCTLGMAVIDYRGYRITAQSIIPGILDKEQEQSVIYGSIDFGKTVVSSEKYHGILEGVAKELKILPHEVVIDEEGKTAKLFTSYETKGIIGNDGRQYVLDLLRTMPPDVHYLENGEVSEKSKALGFPRKFPHKLAALRHELVELFHESRCLLFIRVAAQHIRKHLEDTKDPVVSAEIEKEITRILVDVSEGRDPQTDNEVSKEALTKAAAATNSLRDNTFDIRFNPDCFSTAVKHAPGEDLEKQKSLVIEAADFLLNTQLPELVQNCVDCSVTPIDGEGFCELMHSRGINIRYLGEVVKLIGSSQSFMRPLVACELVSRCLKHILRSVINTLPQDQLAGALSHILNAVFGPLQSDTVSPVEKSSKKNVKKAKKSSVSGEWTAVTTKSLWKNVSDEANTYYGFDLDVTSMDSLCDKYSVQKVSLLRRLCRVLGIQLLNKDYSFDGNKGKLPFAEDDIQGVFPVTKHRQPGASDAKKLYQRGQQAMQMGNLRDAYECIAESVNLMTSVYGALHPELAQALRMLARLSYILGDAQDALAQQHKATMISERCNGLDHGYTVVEYINLAHFAFANLYISAAIRLLYRARHIMLIAHGERHPIMTQIDGNIGVILFAVQEFDAALKFLHSAEAGSAVNGEPKRLKSALLQHMTARAHASRGDYRSALAAEKETYSIYCNLFGADHDKTKDSSEFLKVLTQQAVAFQKRMMEANRNSSIAQLLPMQLPQPSLSSILEVMNILNGIIIISMGNSASSGEEKEEKTEVTEAVLAEETLD